MGPLSDDDGRAANRASLRVKYKKAVMNLIEALMSDPKPKYRSDDLMKLRVTLGSFNPVDQEFLTSNICLFKPMSSKQIKGYSLDMSRQHEGHRDLCNNYDKVDKTTTDGLGRPLRSWEIMERQVVTTFRYLNLHFESSYKETKRYPESLAKSANWYPFREGNPFGDLPRGLLVGRLLTNQIPQWRVRGRYEWQSNYRKPETLLPHMMLVMYTGEDAIEGELLFCELGCIAQVIYNRLQQKEFENTSLFPVLLISLFGPRRGRLVQAKFNKSGVLKVRASPIYSFMSKAKAPWDLFLRYHACEPRDGPEIEFGDDE
ncbi:uncharacterized protein N7515_000595 [Penicillium bovifimosum]|uniref:Uncharacterized protein n=1 Tax=Penicillium bovifimosum TaxID=126998 RepID=A0A9W9HF91_9EURO|nr:uncharacterized protein N7515_000595 [Penicillium bovifimosum]KAJ5146031.1 hypothetical protein N7515_000595 [Penicillium bovifimosum]